MIVMWVVIAIAAIGVVAYLVRRSRSAAALDGVREADPTLAARLDAQNAEPQRRTQNGGGFVGGGLGGL